MLADVNLNEKLVSGCWVSYSRVSLEVGCWLLGFLKQRQFGGRFLVAGFPIAEAVLGQLLVIGFWRAAILVIFGISKAGCLADLVS